MSPRFLNACFALRALLPSTLLGADEEAGEFLRIRHDAYGQPAALQVATKSYVPQADHADGLRIDLIGAVHVGETAYYADLNDRFREYDVVLYELIAAKETPVQAGNIWSCS